MSEETTHNETAPVADPRPLHQRTAAAGYPGLARRISWSSILAGVVLALALQFVFSLLGFAIGFWSFDVQGESGPIGTGAIVYTLASQIISVVAGAFVAARLAGIPKDSTAAIHGVMVWAAATIAMLWLATTAIGTIAGGTVSLVKNTFQGTAQTVEAVLPEDLPSIATPDIDVASLPPEVRNALEENGVTVEQIRREIGDVYDDVISAREERQARRAARSTVRDIATSPGDFEEDINDAIDRLFGQGEPFSQEERRELIASVSDELGLTTAQARQVIDRLEQAAEDAAENVREAAEKAQTEVAETVDEASDSLAVTSFWLFVFSVLGLVAGIFGGIAGEPKHLAVRDDAEAVRA